MYSTWPCAITKASNIQGPVGVMVDDDEDSSQRWRSLCTAACITTVEYPLRRWAGGVATPPTPPGPIDARATVKRLHPSKLGGCPQREKETAYGGSRSPSTCGSRLVSSIATSG